MASQFWAFGVTLSFGTRDTSGAAKKKSTFFSIFFLSFQKVIFIGIRFYFSSQVSKVARVISIGKCTYQKLMFG